MRYPPGSLDFELVAWAARSKFFVQYHDFCAAHRNLKSEAPPLGVAAVKNAIKGMIVAHGHAEIAYDARERFFRWGATHDGVVFSHTLAFSSSSFQLLFAIEDGDRCIAGQSVDGLAYFAALMHDPSQPPDPPFPKLRFAEPKSLTRATVFGLHCFDRIAAMASEWIKDRRAQSLPLHAPINSTSAEPA